MLLIFVFQFLIDSRIYMIMFFFILYLFIMYSQIISFFLSNCIEIIQDVSEGEEY